MASKISIVEFGKISSKTDVLNCYPDLIAAENYNEFKRDPIRATAKHLSKIEKELAAGVSTGEIADKLHVPPAMVKLVKNGPYLLMAWEASPAIDRTNPSSAPVLDQANSDEPSAASPLPSARK